MGEEQDQEVNVSSPLPTTTTTTSSSTDGDDHQSNNNTNDNNNNPTTTTTITTTSTATTNQGAQDEKRYSKYLQNFFPYLTSKIQYDSEDALSYLTPWKDAIEVADEINKICRMHTGQYPNHIIDGTGGLGGNTLGFLNYFWNHRLSGKRVTMIEMNKQRYPMSLNNVKLFIDDHRANQEQHSRSGRSSGSYDDAVSFQSFNENFVSWWRREGSRKYNNFATLVFMDPPWGGQDYKQHETIHDLYLDDEQSATVNDDDMVNKNASENDEGEKKTKQISIKDLVMEILSSGVMGVVLKVPHNYRDRTLTEHDSRMRLRCYVMKKVKYIIMFAPGSGGSGGGSRSNKPAPSVGDRSRSTARDQGRYESSRDGGSYGGRSNRSSSSYRESRHHPYTRRN